MPHRSSSLHAEHKLRFGPQLCSFCQQGRRHSWFWETPAGPALPCPPPLLVRLKSEHTPPSPPFFSCPSLFHPSCLPHPSPHSLPLNPPFLLPFLPFPYLFYRPHLPSVLSPCPKTPLQHPYQVASGFFKGFIGGHHSAVLRAVSWLCIQESPCQAKGPYEVLEIKPGSATCNTSASPLSLLSVLRQGRWIPESSWSGSFLFAYRVNWGHGSVVDHLHLL